LPSNFPPLNSITRLGDEEVRNGCSESTLSFSMKNSAFWGGMPSGSCMNQRFGGPYRLHNQGDKIRRARNVSSNKQLKHAG
jgi:hypothetical protein